MWIFKKGTEIKHETVFCVSGLVELIHRNNRKQNKVNEKSGETQHKQPGIDLRTTNTTNNFSMKIDTVFLSVTHGVWNGLAGEEYYAV